MAPVSDSLANGRRIKCLTVANDISHECLDIAVDWGSSGEYVIRLLDRVAIFHNYPLTLRTDTVRSSPAGQSWPGCVAIASNIC